MSVKFVSAILGPEMAARLLWAPGKMRSFCRKTYVHKISRFRGGGVFWVGGGGSADFIFMGAGIFLICSFMNLLFQKHVSETPVCSFFCLFAIFGGFVRNFD